MRRTIRASADRFSPTGSPESANTADARWSRRLFIAGLAAGATGWSSVLASPFRREAPPVTAADQVLNVAAFEPLAREILPPAHFGYIATGADDDLTTLRNHEAFSHYQIRAHHFNDVSHLSLATRVFKSEWTSPIYLSAVSAMRAFHNQAELGVARAAASRSMQMMLSTGTSTPVQAVAEACGAPLWQQLYPTDDWSVTEGLVRRAEGAGCTAIVLTIDSLGKRNNETLKLAMREDARHCPDCHINNSHDMWRRGPMFTGLDVSRVTALLPSALTLEYLDRLRKIVKGRLMVKGVVTGEDAAAAANHGVDAVIVSNHGGRNEETLRATLDCLPEVVSAVRGRVPVFVDGGVRRGTDVFKALALGATAVGIGRPQAWGLAAFGQEGVEAVIDALNRELLLIMQQAGTARITDIKPDLLVRA